MEPEGVFRPSGSVGELGVLEDGDNTPLSGDCAVRGRATTRQSVRSNNVFVLGNEDMMFSSPKRHGRTQSLEVNFIVSKRATAIWALGSEIKIGY